MRAELKAVDTLACLAKPKKAHTPMKTTKTETTAAPTVAAAPTLVIVPAKVGIQIGERKRYFDTEAEALQALADFTAKHSRVKGTRAKSLTPEQKAAKAQARVALEQYAVRKGLEGKRIAALANVLEELCTDVDGVHALIEAFVATPVAEEVLVLSGNMVEVNVENAGPNTDPLAEFL